MALIVRAFRLRSAYEIEALKVLASGVARRLKARVVLCKQVNDPQVLWVGDAGSEADLEGTPEVTAGTGWEVSSPIALELVDEFYHFPPRSYQVWELEVRASAEEQIQTLRDLLRLSRAVRRYPVVAGFSVYRALEPRGVFVGFLALGWGVTPTYLLWNGLVPTAVSERIARDALWRPLSLVCALNGRAADRPASAGQPIFHLPFWARNPASLDPEEGSIGVPVPGRRFA
jgi:hypothetical protein